MPKPQIRYPLQAVADAFQWPGEVDAACGKLGNQPYIDIGVTTDCNSDTTAVAAEIKFWFEQDRASGFLEAVRKSGKRYRIYIDGTFRIEEDRVDPEDFGYCPGW